MSKLDVIRAWKDEEYRSSLTEEERKLLPEHPAGLIELGDAELQEVGGGAHTKLRNPNTRKRRDTCGC